MADAKLVATTNGKTWHRRAVPQCKNIWYTHADMFALNLHTFFVFSFFRHFHHPICLFCLQNCVLITDSWSSQCNLEVLCLPLWAFVSEFSCLRWRSGLTFLSPTFTHFHSPFVPFGSVLCGVKAFLTCLPSGYVCLPLEGRAGWAGTEDFGSYVLVSALVALLSLLGERSRLSIFGLASFPLFPAFACLCAYPPLSLCLSH